MEQIFQITLCISSLTEYGPGSTQQRVTAMELWSLFHLNSSLFSLPLFLAGCREFVVQKLDSAIQRINHYPSHK